MATNEISRARRMRRARLGIIGDWRKKTDRKDFIHFGKNVKSRIKTLVIYRNNVYVAKFTNPGRKAHPDYGKWWVDIYTNEKIIKKSPKYTTKTQALAYAKAYMRKN